MGENQSKESAYERVPDNAPSQRNTAEEEEVRRRRLAKLDKPVDYRDRPKEEAKQTNVVFKHPLAQNADNVFLDPQQRVGTGSMDRDVQKQMDIIQREQARGQAGSGARNINYPPNQGVQQGMPAETEEEVRQKRLERMNRPPEWRDRPKEEANQTNVVFKHPLAQNNDNVFLEPNQRAGTGSFNRDVQNQMEILQREAANNQKLVSNPAGYPLKQNPPPREPQGQQQQLSEEEIRRRRLEKMSNDPYAPKWVQNQHIGEVVNGLVEDILGITFNKASLDRNSRLKFLPNLQPGDQELRLFTAEKFSDIVQRLLESQIYIPNNEKLAFLCNVVHRLEETLSMRPDDAALLGFRKTLHSFITYYLLMPNVFSPDYSEENHQDPNDLSSTLNNNFYTYLTTSNESAVFLASYVKDIEQDYLNVVLTPIFKRIISNCCSATLDTHQKILSAVHLLHEILRADKRAIDFLVSHELFIPKKDTVIGRSFQKLTVFGAFLSLVTLPEESSWTLTAIKDPKATQKDHKLMVNYRTRIHAPLDAFQKLIEYMMSADQKYKQNIIDWLYQVLYYNEQKSHGQINETLVTDGWFINFYLLLLKLCEKMLKDPTKYPTWFSKISLQYLKEKSIFDKIGLLNGQANVYTPSMEVETQGPKTTPKYTFLTELIFLTSHALNTVVSINKEYESFYLSYKIESSSLNPASQEYFKLGKQEFGYILQIHDPYLISHTVRLFMFQSIFILHTYEVSLTNFENSYQLFNRTYTLSNEQFQTKLSLPLYWCENIYNYIISILGKEDELLAQSGQCLEVVMDFALSTIKNPNWIPHLSLRWNYVGLIGMMAPLEKNMADPKTDTYSFIFKQNPYFEWNLVEGIISFFNEVLDKGVFDDKQYFDKPGYKLSYARIFNYLLESVYPQGKFAYLGDHLKKLAVNNATKDVYLKFLRQFLNRMASGFNILFNSIKEIRAEEEDLQNPAIMGLLDPASKLLRIKTNQKNVQHAKSRIPYMHAFYNVAYWMARLTPNIFQSDDIQNLLVTNLNFALFQLNGPQPIEVNSNDIQKINFDQKALLKNLVLTYLNFRNDSKFINTVINDAQSFNIEMFQKTLVYIHKVSLLQPNEIMNFTDFVKSLAVASGKDVGVVTINEQPAPQIIQSAPQNIQAAPTNIPEKFIDPLTKQIMKDPVLLPTSNNIVDRETIMNHFLNSKTDPFNGEELTEDMLIPQKALRMIIADFLSGDE